MTATRAEVLPGEPAITDDLVREHGLRPQEHDTIKSILQREPTFTELGIFSALWSEHCSYKHSLPILKLFPTEGPRVLQGPGENAGVLRLSDGWAVAFKMESHNHPTAVEPYQGAATGVGGILRDVFTMGARPVALLNSLRFGPLSDPHNRYLFAGAVRGIGDYGNCVGIPTVAGEVSFSRSYSSNPLINAMCVGVVREDEVIRAIAKGPGNVLLAVGARTGRDGIHGASFASEELTDESQARRPQVQVADPFTEKLLLEASLELIASGFIVAIQDMGAAGLTSSSAEMAARGGVGIEIDTARVPTREPDMTPYEILLSESQERMLVVALQDHVADVEEIMHKWELEAVPIGHVTEDGMYRVRHAGVIVAEIPGRQLIEECPVYHAEATEDPLRATLRAQTPDQSDPPPEVALLALLDAPSIASKRWVFEQYDSTVQASTVIGPGHDAGVVRIPGTSIGIAVATDCTSRYVALDPYEGGKAAVVEAARNVACIGARPIGITNCLNFGSPERADVFFQFREACRGIAEACSALGTPVTGGNVSFYNEHPQGVVDPTPVIGMVGVLDDVANVLRSSFTTPGDAILLLGRTRGHLGASAYWEYVLNAVAGSPPPVDLTGEKALQLLLHRVAGRSLAHSCHDVSDGGLAVALAEASIGTPYDESPIGAEVDLREIQGNLNDAEVLFGEDQGRAILSASPADATTVLAEARELGVPATQIGTVGGGADIFQIQLAGRRIEVDPAVLRRTYFDAIPRRMDTIDHQAADT